MIKLKGKVRKDFRDVLIDFNSRLRKITLSETKTCHRLMQEFVPLPVLGSSLGFISLTVYLTLAEGQLNKKQLIKDNTNISKIYPDEMIVGDCTDMESIDLGLSEEDFKQIKD